jgi:hypothetical protein
MSISRARCTALRWAGRLAVLAIPALHTACSESSFTSTLPEDQGDYTASIVVDEENTTQLAGNAIFGTTTNTSGISLNVLYLWTGNPDGNVYDVIWLQRRNLELLEPGDYVIGDVDENDPPADDFVGLYAFAEATGTAATFHSVTGTLTISTAETLELTGTLELVGAFVEDAYHSGVVGDTVQVSGTFRAVAGTIY